MSAVQFKTTIFQLNTERIFPITLRLDVRYWVLWFNLCNRYSTQTDHGEWDMFQHFKRNKCVITRDSRRLEDKLMPSVDHTVERYRKNWARCNFYGGIVVHEIIHRKRRLETLSDIVQYGSQWRCCIPNYVRFYTVLQIATWHVIFLALLVCSSFQRTVLWGSE